jgi:hypothetical protein
MTFLKALIITVISACALAAQRTRRDGIVLLPRMQGAWSLDWLPHDTDYNWRIERLIRRMMNGDIDTVEPIGIVFSNSETAENPAFVQIC